MHTHTLCMCAYTYTYMYTRGCIDVYMHACMSLLCKVQKTVSKLSEGGKLVIQGGGGGFSM